MNIYFSMQTRPSDFAWSLFNAEFHNKFPFKFTNNISLFCKIIKLCRYRE